MELVNVREIFKNTIRYENQQVTIGGWVRSNRNSKNFGFIVVNDGTFFEPIQVVYGDGLENYEEVCKINVGAKSHCKRTAGAYAGSKTAV